MYCGNCGIKVLEGSNFCSYCGFDLKNNSTNKNSSSYKTEVKNIENEDQNLNQSEVQANPSTIDMPGDSKNSNDKEKSIPNNTEPVNSEVVNDVAKKNNFFKEKNFSNAKVIMGEYDEEIYKARDSESNKGPESINLNNGENDEAFEDFILDRDEIYKEQNTHVPSSGIKKILLLVALVTICISAVFGVRQLNQNRIKREEQLKVQEELRKAEEERKQIEGYLALADQFIVASENQLSNYNNNLKQLSKIETANWFKKLNFGSFFNSIVDKLMGMDSYTQLGTVSSSMDNVLKDMNNPPDKLRDIYVVSQKLSAKEKVITSTFSGNLKKKDYDDLKTLISEYSDEISELKNTSDNFRKTN